MMRSEPKLTLTIVIPALNEEDAIGATIERCLAARESIQKQGGVDSVEIIVVSDGSTDRTVEIASGYRDVQLVVFETNQGYGAAIKEGFRRGTGSLVGFLDADGTCDPNVFADLCRAIRDENADIALGSRMGPSSQMPLVRRIGNSFYAVLLGFLCGHSITDTASGMRVIRRSSLQMLYPLPDGLHFTPSMSARALLNGLRVVEVPMSYRERVGTSKLRIGADGLRFLSAIFDGVLCYRPERLFLLGFAACLALAVLIGLHPLEFYLRQRFVEEWMIYRFSASLTMGTAGYILLCAGVLASQMAPLGPRRRNADSFWAAIIARFHRGVPLVCITAAALAVSLFLLWPGIVQYLTTGKVYLHWSRVLTGCFGLLIALQCLTTGIMMRVAEVWRVQREHDPTGAPAGHAQSEGLPVDVSPEPEAGMSDGAHQSCPAESEPSTP